jgi:hypothetical protein
MIRSTYPVWRPKVQPFVTSLSKGETQNEGDDGLLGIIVEAQAYDIGRPDSYLEALQRLHKG